MEIIIPDCFLEKIQADANWNSYFSSFLQNTTAILDRSPFFFPEYTKHNVEHVNQVLKIAEKLFVHEIEGEFNAKAATIFCMSVVLHDIGMFLEADGLKTLLNDPNWKSKWQTYAQEVNHYSDSELHRRIGSWGDILLPRKLPNTFDASLNEWERCLCGEFLRQHHPELAEYITEKGFPGKDGTYIDLFNSVTMEKNLRKTIGLIAHSHGMSLNDVEKPLRKIWGRQYKNPQNIPVYFLMALLRMGDYLDAGEDRAPHIVLEMKRFLSQRSYDEFKWNDIVNVEDGWNSTDPESYERLYVNVIEDDLTSTVFLKVEDWLNSVQQELDTCWRYLSLHYQSRYPLSIRIIESNLFDEERREALQERFVIDRAELSAAPEVLSLLAEPLYDDNPSYGVRELLQNALDACQERKADGGEYEPKITVAIETRTTPQTFTITDNGIGMAKDVIIKHFLRAGSSYRSSMEWKMAYGDKKVPRTGKFGIGVLAAFLIGDEVTVETIPVGECSGYRFTMKKDSYVPVNIERFEDDSLADGGTRITIPCDADSILKTQWTGWYWLPEQQKDYINSVCYFVDGRVYLTRKRYSTVSGRWFELKNSTPYESFFWSPSNDDGTYCNGIRIEYNAIKFNHNTTMLANGAISLIDSNMLSHIDLSRKHLSDISADCKKRYYLERVRFGCAALLLLNPVLYFYEIERLVGGIGLLIWWKGFQQPYPDILRRIGKDASIWFLEHDWSETKMWDDFFFSECFDSSECFWVSEQSISPYMCSLIEQKKDECPIPFFCTNEIKELIHPLKCGVIPDDSIPERSAIIKDYFGDEPWIPFEMDERIKKFSHLFQRDHELFKYMDWISKFGDRDIYYNIYDYLPPEETTP